MNQNHTLPDFIIRLHIHTIGLLDHGPFEIDIPPYYNQPFSISFWFQTNNLKNRQVIANHGCKAPEQAGWSVFIEEHKFYFNINWGENLCADIATPLSRHTAWRHFLGVANPEDGKLIGYLDGSSEGWENRHYVSSVPVDSIHPAGKLTLGGYTDPAGGHFDHTFGRNGTGMIDDFRICTRSSTPIEITTSRRNHSKLPAPEIAYTTQREVAPVKIDFVADFSAEIQDSIRHCIWDFGDGFSGMGATVSHDYPYAGTYAPKLTVISDDYRTISTRTTLKLGGRKNPLQFTPVFINGTEGHACYRIPAIVRATNGDLVVFAEGRLESCSDSTKTIRIVSKRSSDNGKTWSMLQIVSRNIVLGEEFACQDPSPVVDLECGTGKIILLFNEVEFNEWDSVRGAGIRRVACICSTDHGVTWGRETDITLQVHKPYNPNYVDIYPKAASPENRTDDWRKQIPTRGHAIQLKGSKDLPVTKGRLFFTGAINRGENSIFYSENYVFWSDDLGKSWQIGGIIEQPRSNGASSKGLSEAMAVELENGDILINSRNYQDGVPVNRRAITLGSFNADGKIHFQPSFNDETLIEPPVQASIIRFTYCHELQYGGKSRIVFSNPAHERDRVNMTIRLSYDEGQTWPVSKTLDPGASSYGDLVVLDDMTLGLLYERGNQGGIWFTHFDLEWLTDGKDSLKPITGVTP